jgi:hypothetical protein
MTLRVAAAVEAALDEIWSHVAIESSDLELATASSIRSPITSSCFPGILIWAAVAIMISGPVYGACRREPM